MSYHQKSIIVAKKNIFYLATILIFVVICIVHGCGKLLFTILYCHDQQMRYNKKIIISQFNLAFFPYAHRLGQILYENYSSPQDLQFYRWQIFYMKFFRYSSL